MRRTCPRRTAMVAALLAAAAPAGAQDAAPATVDALAELSLEELGNVQVTTVARRSQALSDAPAAVFVITAEDIRRSGATSLPEALRLAPNLHVARLNAAEYVVAARGFASGTTNKLLVLRDGRSVYTNLTSGVFWDAQQVLLADVERIEVISGPGGTLWGSNAVNGVINIITRSAADTQGTLLRGIVGTEEHAHAAVRHGGVSGRVAWRIHAAAFARDEAGKSAAGLAGDHFRSTQAGFRLDWSRDADAFTVIGDALDGSIDEPAGADTDRRGLSLVSRWRRELEGGGSVELQGNADTTRRNRPAFFQEERDNLELDFQHALRRRGRHSVLWGAAWRRSSDDVGNVGSLAFLPASRTLDRPAVFLQDEIALRDDRLNLTLGTKLERNDYTGWEVQPAARLAWRPRQEHLVWAAVSRAVRSPSRIDRDFFSPATPPFLLAGGPGFRSETLLAWELGFRRHGPRGFLSLAGYRNSYRHLRTLELDPGLGIFTIGNGMEGDTWGIEAWGEIRVTEDVRLLPGYAFLDTDLELLPDSTSPTGPAGEGNDPRHRVVLGALWSATPAVQVDVRARHVASLPDPPVPSYTTLDLRIAWEARPGLTLELVGQDLLDGRHAEFGAPDSRQEIERSAFVKATWTF